MKLEDFYVCEEFGFMLPDPLRTLPDYFGQWNYLAENLTSLILQKQLREEVDKMPVLDHNKLKGYRQLRLAHLQLSMISSAYIWQEGDKGVPKVLPECVAVPWYKVSEKIDIKPVVCHPDMVLCNWTLLEPHKPRTLENLRCLYTFPGGMDSNWFFMVTARMEFDFAPAPKYIIDAIKASDTEDTEALIQNLILIKQVILHMKETLKNMHELVSAEVFYDTLRPFLSGWGGEGSPFPEGLIYEGISEEPIQMSGGSAAQSSTLQCLDAAFSVQHETSIQKFLLKMRDHMPSAHKKFIETISEKSSIRSYVQKSDDKGLKQCFNQVLEAMIDFRSYHLQVVTKYVVIMSNRQTRNQDYESLSKKGTGGTSLLPFLKSIRQSTTEKLVEQGN
ncbi:indoleamine 2,3-dioxygenase 2-like [Mytilus galloprovincialis]|uniref:indoleamine 2,3-dioxygenase 2-like n=1 Tax=Mytilus galloprovincialis TaxID=29158 RepID=UPI003F7C0121